VAWYERWQEDGDAPTAETVTDERFN